jgi:predicted MarR family transcription regulator
MPYYRITLYYDDGSSVKCIRQHNSWDIEYVNRYFMEQTKKTYSGKKISDMEVVMVTRQSEEVRKFITAQGHRSVSS